jgi:hypothetical protein
MSKQWHPLFAHLLKLLLGDYYDVQTEVPVSELPRRGDILVLRRQGGQTPPFHGVWENLTDSNVFEFKGPSDDAEPDDLELLIHVGTGLTYRWNEERSAKGEPRLVNQRVSFWYLAPTLGETFLQQARSRCLLDYQTAGLWRGRVWGHPLWLLAYRDAAVEVDTLPLRLLVQDPAPLHSLAVLLVQRPEVLSLFASFLTALQPALWEEIRSMSTLSSGPKLDWEAIGKITDLGEVLNHLPPERVIERFGVERAIQVIGLERLVGIVGLPRLIEAVGREKVMDELVRTMSEEQLQTLLQRRQQQK